MPGAAARGLEQLEYRGYDSAGLSLLADGRLERTRAVGNLSRLRRALKTRPPGAVATLEEDVPSQACAGIGHTRWATHGGVTGVNAHPHADADDRIHIVLNGIVENHVQLRRTLFSQGVACISETDAEVVAHLIALHHDGDLVEAVQRARQDLEGHFAFVAICADEPDLLVGTRRECPLVVGRGAGRAVPGLLRRRVLPSRAPDPAGRGRRGRGRHRRRPAASSTRPAAPSAARTRRFESDDAPVRPQGFETFMLKEIHEQPQAVAATVRGPPRRPRASVLPELGLSDAEMRRLERISIVGCGTSYHAGLLGRHAIQEWAGLPVSFDIASEYRYGDPRVGPGDLVIGTTQSGETADTLAAMRLARARGARVVALTNVPGSQATRDSDGALFTRAGMEVGVAATKTFVCQVTALYLLALRLGQARGTLPPRRPQRAVRRAGAAARPRRAGPADDGRADARDRGAVRRRRVLPLHGAAGGPARGARGSAEAEGDLLHPVRRLRRGRDEARPDRDAVRAHARDLHRHGFRVLGKLLSNMAEVRARRAHVIAIATEGAKEVAEHAEEIVYLPSTDWLLGPLLAAVPLQLLAYNVARARGLNVDQPRNLAKTVTVE